MKPSEGIKGETYETHSDLSSGVVHDHDVNRVGHAPKVGANGGAQTDAGSFHVEIVPQGTTLQVFLRDHSNKAVLTDGYKGTAIFVIDGKPQRIPLTSAGENKLTGTSTVSIPSEPKGAVQITTPSGSTVQAKFN